MTACLVASCPRTAIAHRLCERHYDALRRSLIRDGDWRSFRVDHSTQIACKCVRPKWDTCAPFFPSVHECRWCGSPHPDEFGKAFS